MKAKNSIVAHEIPWEKIPEKGVRSAFLQTMYQCLFKPSHFFSTITEQSSKFYAWIYAMVIGSIGIIFDLLWQSSSMNIFETYFNIDMDGYSSLYIPSLLFSPIMLSCNIYLLSFYIHFLLFITKGNRKKFSTTFILSCYIQSVSILYCIPFIGKFISFIWGLYLIVTGISRIQNTSRIRSVFTIFFPVIIFLAMLLFMILAILSGTIIIGSLFKDFLPIFR